MQRITILNRCHRPAAGYEHLAERQFEFIPLWGFLVFLFYRMRRVNCPTCGVVVEEVPWASGQHQLTKVYMQFLAHGARKLSWKETAAAFRTSWKKVCHSVEYVVSGGLEHRTRAPIRAIGVDELQYAKGRQYRTLVYQIDAGLRRLLGQRLLAGRLLPLVHHHPDHQSHRIDAIANDFAGLPLQPAE